jgi:poly(3-hydroxybutyrate) depolymerase
MIAGAVAGLVGNESGVATDDMKDLDIDSYLAELNVAIDDLGGRVKLVGLCQGGWMSAMAAARFPKKVDALVLAGAPIDTDAGDGPSSAWRTKCRLRSTKGWWRLAAAL